MTTDLRAAAQHLLNVHDVERMKRSEPYYLAISRLRGALAAAQRPDAGADSEAVQLLTEARSMWVEDNSNLGVRIDAFLFEAQGADIIL